MSDPIAGRTPDQYRGQHGQIPGGPVSGGTGTFTFEQFEAFAERFLAGLDGGGGGGGFRPFSFGETKAGFQFQAAQDRAAQFASQKHDKTLLGLRNDMDILAAKRDRAFQTGERIAGQKFQLQFLKKQQQFQKVEAQKDRDFQKELRKEDLKAERQKIFVDLLGKDPIRALIFASGQSGQILPGGERFEDLPALKGTEQATVKAEGALDQLLSGEIIPPTSTNITPRAPTGDIDIGEFGVTGLPPAIKAARAFQETGGAGKTVLSSAFGVGDIREGQQPGITPDDFLELIQSVTPKGVLQ